MTRSEALKILGLDNNASEKEIDKAFRSLAAKNHPDVNGGSEDKFKEINSAYQALKNNTTKEEIPFNQPFTNNGFSDFIDQILRQHGVSNFNQVKFKREIPIVNVTLTFVEAALGTSKNITYKFYDKCLHCNGNGMINNIKCNHCNASCVIESSKSLNIQIPSVIGENFLTIPRQGNFHGNFNGINHYGDLGIKINVIPDEKMSFIPNSLDIVSTEKISLLQALTGDTLDVNTVHGGIKLKIPQNIKSGTILSAARKGAIRNGFLGNHLFKIDVEYPENTDKLIKFLKRNVNNKNK